MSQQWRVVDVGMFLKFVNRRCGKVLDVCEGSKAEGTTMILWDEKSEGADNQRWSWDGFEKGRRLRSKLSDLVLDIDDSGNVIQRKSNEKSKTQVWTVKEVKWRTPRSRFHRSEHQVGYRATRDWDGAANWGIGCLAPSWHQPALPPFPRGTTTQQRHTTWHHHNRSWTRLDSGPRL